MLSENKNVLKYCVFPLVQSFMFKDAECGYWRVGEFVWDVTVILGFDWLILLSDWLISVTCQTNIVHLTTSIQIYIVR